MSLGHTTVVLSCGGTAPEVRIDEQKGVKMANGNGETISEITDLKNQAARDRLPDLCAQYREYSQEKSALEAAMKSIKQDIDAIAKKARIVNSVGGDGWQLTRVTSTRRTLSKERLLEKGVKMPVIEYATTEKRSTYYRVLDRKEEASE